MSTGYRVPIKAIKLLLNKGADGSELDISSTSPLASYLKWYMLQVDLNICRLMLSVQGSSLFIDKDGQNLGHLHALTAECNVQVLEILREHSVNLTRKDSQNRTVLHLAVISGSITEESLHYLLHGLGIEINAEDASGKTALQLAVDMATKYHDQDIYDAERWDRTLMLLRGSDVVQAASRTMVV